jgi:hypothetical protein
MSGAVPLFHLYGFMTFTGTVVRFKKIMFLKFFTNGRGLNKILCHLRVETVKHVVSLEMETMCALLKKATALRN